MYIFMNILILSVCMFEYCYILAETSLHVCAPLQHRYPGGISVY